VASRTRGCSASRADRLFRCRFDGGLDTARFADRFDLAPVARQWRLGESTAGHGGGGWRCVIAVDGVIGEWLVTQFGLGGSAPIDMRRLSLPVYGSVTILNGGGFGGCDFLVKARREVWQ